MSREIDAEIAEKLFGSKLVKEYWMDGDGEQSCKIWEPKLTINRLELPHYSTTWEGMGLVVEKLLSEWNICFDSCENRFKAVFEESGPGCVRFAKSNWVESAPMAVALAALKTVEKK